MSVSWLTRLLVNRPVLLIRPLPRYWAQKLITVGGYTDNLPVGPQLMRMGISNNIDLSSKRAGAVVTYFKSQGVNPSLLSAQGFGDAHPIAPNDTPEGRAKNRRVEITLAGDGT